MSVNPEDIAAARALRDEARSIVTSHLDEVRADLSPQTISDRLKHKASHEAIHVLDETRAVATENKLVIGATLAALAGWFARKPLISVARRIPLPGILRNSLERLWP